MMQRVLLGIARRSWRAYRFMNFTVTSNGVRVPVGSGIGLELLGEPHALAPTLACLYASRHGAFIDIGANIGAVALALIRLDPCLPYVGFEPLARAAVHVQRLIDANGLGETHAVHPIALGDTIGTTTLFTNGDADVSATTTLDLRPESMYADRVRVCISTGDIQLRDIKHMAVIKIDAEGAERRVLAGLRETIEKHRPALIMEIMPFDHLEDDSYAALGLGELTESERARLVSNRKRNMTELSSLMERLGYRFSQFRDGALRPARPSDSTLANQDFIALPAQDLNA